MLAVGAPVWDDGFLDEEEMVEAPEAPPDPWAGFTDFMAGEVEY